MVWFFGQTPLASFRPAESETNINRKSAAIFDPGVCGAANRFDLRGKTIKDGPKAVRPILSVMAGQKREARLRAICPGHPRLSCSMGIKTWMPGTRPGMTSQPKVPD